MWSGTVDVRGNRHQVMEENQTLGPSQWKGRQHCLPETGVLEGVQIGGVTPLHPAPFTSELYSLPCRQTHHSTRLLEATVVHCLHQDGLALWYGVSWVPVLYFWNLGFGLFVGRFYPVFSLFLWTLVLWGVLTSNYKGVRGKQWMALPEHKKPTAYDVTASPCLMPKSFSSIIISHKAIIFLHPFYSFKTT